MSCIYINELQWLACSGVFGCLFHLNPCLAEVKALPARVRFLATGNRRALLAGLQPGVTEVSFELRCCSQAELTLLIKALGLQGARVCRVTIKSVEEEGILNASMASLARALACCTGLQRLR